MTKEQFLKLQLGDVVRGAIDLRSYVVTAIIGERVTAVDVVDLKNPDAWDLVSPDKAPRVAREYQRDWIRCGLIPTGEDWRSLSAPFSRPGILRPRDSDRPWTHCADALPAKEGLYEVSVRFLSSTDSVHEARFKGGTWHSRSMWGDSEIYAWRKKAPEPQPAEWRGP